MDDATAIARVREGQVDAFAEVVERYEVPILRYLARMTGDADVARDSPKTRSSKLSRTS
jgi:hypothetical protein